MNYLSENSEINENRLAANKVLAFLPFGLIVYVLNQMGIFHVDTNLFTIAFSIDLFCILLIQLAGRIDHFSAKKYTKYLIILLTFIFTLSILSLLNFHAILVLCLPMVVALNYHSRKISYLTFGLTLLAAVLWPLIGAYFGFWGVDFFVFLIRSTDPSIINGTVLENYLVETRGRFLDIFIWLSLPQMGFALVFGAILEISNRITRRTYRKQIKDLKDSRDSILAGMSDIMENRDFNTGGHIKRTSEVVKLLVESLPLDSKGHKMMDDDYADCVIRTAPMHDLGKIAIPDEILNKPARLSPEEFEKIKIHPQKSFDIVSNVLIGLKDETLMKVAENIALYHHERYDGTGYPKGLKGEDIPLEARIMAIADVYDALVSKRCYKESMSHKEAFEIIKNSMGTHFDPKLWPCFEKAYPQIVSFYS